MNGVGLTTVGRLLGHRKRCTTAIYAHLDDSAAQAAAVIAGAMGYKAEPPPLPDEVDDDGSGAAPDSAPIGETRRGQPPLPDTRKHARDRSQWDWEYGLESRATLPHHRDGPRYIKIGRRVIYDRADLEEWVEERKRRFTGEARNAPDRPRAESHGRAAESRARPRR